MGWACSVCVPDEFGKGPGTEPVLCPECEELLRWFRAYFRHAVADPELITPETTFHELGVESLDYMDWLLEAEEKFGVRIPDEEAERILTVGEFLRTLKKLGAVWPPDHDLELTKETGLLWCRLTWTTVFRELGSVLEVEKPWAERRWYRPTIAQIMIVIAICAVACTWPDRFATAGAGLLSGYITLHVILTKNQWIRRAVEWSITLVVVAFLMSCLIFSR